METIIIIICLISIVSLIIAGIVSNRKFKSEKNKLEETKKEAKKIMEEALKEAEIYKKEAEIKIRQLEIELKEKADSEIKERRSEILVSERRIFQKEEQLLKKEEKLDKEEEILVREFKSLEEKKKELDNIEEEKKKELYKVANLSEEEAKNIILEELNAELINNKAKIITKYKEEIEEEKVKISKEILSNTIQRCAADHTSEATVTVVEIPNDEIKGKIIGKEGRNIRSLEMLTGVQFIIDDTPESITVSAFDPVRREVARIALEKLIKDGRIQPAKIEEMVERAIEEVDEVIKEYGKDAMLEAGINDLPLEIIKNLGKLKYRTSYGQNVLVHSVEVANIAGILAKQIGADVKVAMRAGLLHDIGKALDHDPNIIGTHVELGTQLLKDNGENHIIVNAVEAHHQDVDAQSVEAVLVQAADAISSSRPGARRDSFESYIKRLHNLEEIANSFEGVNKAYAISAGREIRLIVDPKKVSDEEMCVISHEVAKRIENEVAFPGQIKVVVIRELRNVNCAKKSKVNMNSYEKN